MSSIFVLPSQSQEIEFQWKDVLRYDIDEDGRSFNFEYNRPGKKARVVKIFSPYVSHHSSCYVRSSTTQFLIVVLLGVQSSFQFFGSAFERIEDILTVW